MQFIGLIGIVILTHADFTCLLIDDLLYACFSRRIDHNDNIGHTPLTVEARGRGG